jgi:putative membrane protein
MAISIRFSILATAVGFAASLGCDHPDQYTTPSSTTVTPQGPSVASNARETSAPSTGQTTSTATSNDVGANMALTDAQIVSIMSTANTGEMDQANAALARGTSAKVKGFAQHMIKDHTQAGKDFTELAQKKALAGQDSDVSHKLDTDGKSLLTRLESTPIGSDFDRRYMDAQVKEHQDLLDLLDSHLIPGAKDDDLTSLLKKVRAKVSDHLKMARDIDSALQS